MIYFFQIFIQTSQDNLNIKTYKNIEICISFVIFVFEIHVQM